MTSLLGHIDVAHRARTTGHFVPAKASWRRFFRSYLQDPLGEMGDAPSPCPSAAVAPCRSATTTPTSTALLDFSEWCS